MEAHTRRSTWVVSLLTLSTCGIIRYAAAFGLGERLHESLAMPLLTVVPKRGRLAWKCMVCY